MENRKDSAKKKRKGSGNGLLIAAVLLTILFLAGVMSLGALYYLEKNRAKPQTIPPKVTEVAATANASSVETKTEVTTKEANTNSNSQGETVSQEEQSSEAFESESSSESESESVMSSTLEESASENESESFEEVSSEEESTEEESTESEEVREAKEAVLDKYTNLGMITGVRNYLNMRKGPSTDYEICGVIFKNCAVEILEEKDGWMKIESGGATGYVSAEYVTTGEKARKLALSSMKYMAEILTDSVDALYEPKEGADVITTFFKGERYDINGETKDWVEIEAVTELSGYVKRETVYTGYFLDEAIYFSLDGVSETRQNLIRKAFEYYGGTYVWGGKELTAEGGVDCSGYTMCLYRMFGVSLPEFSGAQAEVGVTVDEDTIRPGDLIFYVGRYPGVIGHVAIYIGNGKIIHAASESKGICVSSWKYGPPVVMKNVMGD